MSRKVVILFFIFIFSAVFAQNLQAQTSRKAVGAAEVNGTFRSYFGGKFKGSYSEIKILALGKNKLKVRFDLTYPFVDGTGELSANVGEAEGIAEISGDTAVFASEDEYGKCRITIKFVRPGEIKVTENSENAGCGFGLNVTAAGTYKKTSGAKPAF
jgi:hypothetical protein